MAMAKTPSLNASIRAVSFDTAAMIRGRHQGCATRLGRLFPAGGLAGEARGNRRFCFGGRLSVAGSGGNLALQLFVVRQAGELIDEQQRLLRRDLEFLAAALARHLVVEAE